MFSTHFLLACTILLSLTVLFLVAPRILPSRILAISPDDEIDDLTLFRRATAAATARKHHPNPSSQTPPKIAFLFLTNSDLHFAPLWERFFRDNASLFNIYIHADPTDHVKCPGGVFSGRFIPARRTQRASPTLISAERRLLATALLDDDSNAFFALLSQHCVPVHSFHFVYHSLFTPLPENSNRRHYRSFIEILDDSPVLWSRYIARGKRAMMPEIPFSSFRVGSQFFILTRPHAMLVIGDRRLWRKFKLPCYNLHSCYPEEHYFPTLLSMKDPEGCKPITLTRVNWTETIDGHPYTYRAGEISRDLVDRLRVSNSSGYSYFFARKFSPDCLEPLIKMADDVLFRD